MRARIILILLLFTGIATEAQFTGTDSLRNYNNKYITNNPATAFTNLRLNTLLRGIIDWVDTARAGTGGGGALGVDTLWALNDTTIRYKKNGVFRNFVIRGSYDYRRKVDTAYAVNDTTLQIKINGSPTNIIIRGNGGSSQNLANANLTANADYTHGWNQNQLYIDGIRILNLSGQVADGDITNRDFNFKLTTDNHFNAIPLWMQWALMHDGGLTDSVGFRLISDKAGTIFEHFGNSAFNTATLTLYGGPTNQRALLRSYGNLKASTLEVGDVITITPSDSLRIKSTPAANADSVLAVRAFGTGTNTIVKIPKSAIGTTLTNATGPGDTLLTASNTIKRLRHDATLTFSINGNAILMGADTISYVTTPNKLRDTAAALRAVIARPPIDVFLIAGQSNAVGHGDSALSPKVSNGNIIQINAGEITPANDPIGKNISGSSHRAVYGSAWPSFGITYYNATGKKIAFIPSAYDGSAQTVAAQTVFNNWDTTGILFDSAVARTVSSMQALTNAGYNPVFKGILWVQGEADATAINRGLTTQADYLAAFRKMIRKFRTSFADVRMPFYIFRTGTRTDTLDTGYKLIRDAQKTVASTDTATLIVYYNTIDYPQRGLMNGVSHYVQSAYNEMGSLAASAVITGHVSNIDDILTTENNTLLANRQIDINSKKLDILSGTTPYFGIGLGNRVNSFRAHLFGDSLTQNVTTANNVIRSTTFFGERTIEGTPYNFFVAAPLRAYSEASLSANPSALETSLSVSRYLFLNHNASVTRINNHYSQAIGRIRGTVSMYTDNGNGIVGCYGHAFNYIFTRASDYTNAPVINSDTIPDKSNTNINVMTGIFNAGDIQANGWYSGISTELAITTAAHNITNYGDIVLGKELRSGGSVGSRYGLYILPLKKSWVTNAYSIYQAGTTDTNYLAGITRFPNLTSQTDTTTFKPAVVDASGNISKMASWPGGSGGGGTVSMAIGGAITSATAGSVLFAGTGGLLQQKNAHFFWDSTNSRLGLGTNSPSVRLHVDGSTSIDNGFLSFNSAAPSFSGSNPQIGRFGSGFVINANSYDFNNLGNTVGYMSINSSGNVMIPKIATGASAPSTTGTTKMVITDANGMLSFANLPDVITASNGLTRTSNDIALGGALTVNRTTITGADTAKRIIIASQAGLSGSVLRVENSYNGVGASSGYVIEGVHTGGQGAGVRGVSTTGSGILGIGGTGVEGATLAGVGIKGSASDTVGIPLYVDATRTNTGSGSRVYTDEVILRNSGVVVGNGIGTKKVWNFPTYNSGGTPIGFRNMAEQEVRMITYNGATQKSRMTFRAIEDSTLSDVVTIEGKKVQIIGSLGRSVRTVTSNTTLTNGDYWIRIDASAGNVTITLPAASTSFTSDNTGIELFFKRIDNSINTVTIQRAGSDTIESATSFLIVGQWAVNALICASTSTWEYKQ